MKNSEVHELVDLILFGDVHEAPWSYLDGLIQDELITKPIHIGDLNDEEEVRISIAATIMQKYLNKESTEIDN